MGEKEREPIEDEKAPAPPPPPRTDPRTGRPFAQERAIPDTGKQERR